MLINLDPREMLDSFCLLAYTTEILPRDAFLKTETLQNAFAAAGEAYGAPANRRHSSWIWEK